MRFKSWQWGIPFFNRVYGLEMNGLPFEDWPPLLHMATSKGIALHFFKLSGYTNGWVSLLPRDSSGAALESMDDLVRNSLVYPREHELFSSYAQRMAQKDPLVLMADEL